MIHLYCYQQLQLDVTMCTDDLGVVTGFDNLITELQSSTSYKDFTHSLQQFHSQLPLLTSTQLSLLWSCIPSSHLSQLMSCLRFEEETQEFLNILVTLLSCMRLSPDVLHSISYINCTPLLMKIGYGPDSVAMDTRQLALECLECVSYIPECQSVLLSNNALSIIPRMKQSSISHTVLSNLGENTSFVSYSHLVIEILQVELSSCGGLDKYRYTEHMYWVLNCFEPFQFTITHTLILLLRDLFILLRNKVNVDKQLLALRTTSLLLSLFNLHSLCKYTSVETCSELSLDEMLDLLLLIVNLILVNIKLWLDMYMHAGENHYPLSLPMISYTNQLIRMLEEVEESDCILLKNSDKCYDFICKSLLTVEDISISFCHLLVYAEENSNHLEPSLSRSILSLLSLYLSDHELNKHIDLLSKLCPILVKLLCNVPMEEFYTELDTFNVSLLHDNSSFCNFCVSLQEKLSDQMTEFLSVAVNMSQHPQLPLATSGYLHLLVIYFCKNCVTSFIDKPDSDINNENKSIILEIMLTNLSAIPVDYSLYKLTTSLILINMESTQSISQLEYQILTLLVSGLSDCDFISSLPQNLAETLQHVMATSVATPLKQ